MLTPVMTRPLPVRGLGGPGPRRHTAMADQSISVQNWYADARRRVRRKRLFGLGVVTLVGLGVLAALLNYLTPRAEFRAGLALSSGATPDPMPGQPLSIRFLNVGNGDAALLQWGAKSALIDCGPPEAAGKLVASLRRYEVSRLDWVITTCPVDEHIGGFASVLKAFPVDHVVDAGYNTGSEVQAEFLRLIRDSGTDYRLAQRNTTVDLGEGAALYFLAPPDPLLENTGSEDSDSANNSIVTRLMYGRARILFTGDMLTAERDDILSRASAVTEGPGTIRADLLKVSDHGSFRGTDERLVQLVKPSAAVISCGARNPSGTPNGAVLLALKNAGVKVFRTDLEGDVTLRTDGDRLWVSTSHPPTADVWRAGRAD